jgi:hypothetical protein
MPLETRLREHLRAEFDLVPARSGRVVVGQPATTRQTRRRPRGPVLAGGVALLVVVVGLSGPILLAGDGAMPSDTLDASTTIDWTVWEAPGGAQVASGPEGFVRAVSGSSSRARVEYSVDGRTWEPTSFDPAPPVNVGRVLATPDMWMLASEESNGSLNAYLSADGRNWFRAEWPTQLKGIVTNIQASRFGFLALSGTGSEIEMWTSDTGVEWDRWDALEAENENLVLGGPDGWVALGGELGARIQAISVSNDGRTWSSGELAIPSESAPFGSYWMAMVNAGRVGERWVAIAVVNSAGSRPLESAGLAVHVWTSDDGSTWTWQGSPSFGADPSFAVSGTIVFEHGLVFVAPVQTTVQESDGSTLWSPTKEIYVSADGVNWDVTYSIDIYVEDLALRTLEDGSTAGVLVGVDFNSNG